MLLYNFEFPQNSLRDMITKAYRMDETTCLNQLIATVTFNPNALDNIRKTATQLVLEARQYKQKATKVDALLHKYDLSTEEGIALMCLAEALLRIPDTATMDKFISDKISTGDWKTHLGGDNSFFVNATTWSLLLTGKIFAPELNTGSSLANTLKKTTARLGIAVIRPIILQMMRTIGKQFVIGEDINAAIAQAKSFETRGYRFSYDMLGEAARTEADAAVYYHAYVEAIEAIGASVQPGGNPIDLPGISVKLSALHPRYEFSQYELAIKEVAPKLLTLTQLAKKYNIGLTVDAEEADRLDLSLDIIERVFLDPSLQDWEGFGLAIQAYQKRAFFVIDWLADLAKRGRRQIMTRLVKGAYWDTEIKTSQTLGINYPVFTRKHATDVSYIACAKKLLAYPQYFYPQFGTHNAYSIAAILEMAGEHNDFEFQCLYGMGSPLYEQMLKTINRPVRIYAPVGTHRDLLGYLVRRLLENGANNSFINRIADDKIPVEKIVVHPVERMRALTSKPHPRIPLPRYVYGGWLNAKGIDLSDRAVVKHLRTQMDAAAKIKRTAGPIINGKHLTPAPESNVYAPSNLDVLIGHTYHATETDIEQAIQVADHGRRAWADIGYEARAAILEKAADLYEVAMPELITLLSSEGGKCVPDCIAEIRETIDYCRYYAYRARQDLRPVQLPGPTGEQNIFSLHPRGVIACISPWNFPLAIFTGQVVAALVTGNCVIAKPSEQTNLIAHLSVQILHKAGVPAEVLQFVPCRGSLFGKKVVADQRIAGVMFTGSTETAKTIERTLANREGPIGILIAETGGQNAMIVDSSALAEQTVLDICQSAFNSAGQRCSALRVLFAQEEIAPHLLAMLKGYMETLKIGAPALLSTDIGPVIDKDAETMLKAHVAKMQQAGRLLAQIPLNNAQNGYYFAPCAFEINDLSILEGEVFGPILHVIRYQATKLNQVMESIRKTGFGLTLGIHSRIDATVQYVANHMPVGNQYVNRNMIGAVVGVQPFGGEGLSGTGPKAGGPHYLSRLCVERTLSNNTAAVGGNARLVSLLEDDNDTTS